MTDNMRIWDALSKTDPKHTKPFTRGGGFKGTATKPIWHVLRLTELFGPCGIGWGMHKPEFQTVNAGDEILVFCTVGLWYREDDKAAPTVVYGVGGDKVRASRQSGAFNNDEAFKASYTDALSNAMKQIGVSADVHMGLFDDNKYVQQVKAEFAAAEFADDPDVKALATKDAYDPQTGELRSNYDAKAALKAKDWADSAIQSINLGTSGTAIDWRRAASEVPAGKRKSPLEWLKDNSPGQYLRVRQAFQNAVGEDLEAL